MTQPKPSKPGSVQITKMGHTSGTKFGQNPSVQERGASTPTPLSVGKGS
jgi:hypothetical protein